MSRDMARQFVLFVDDDTALRDAFSDWGELHQFDVETFGTAEEAAPRLERGDVGVLMTDSLQDHGMSGLQLLRHAAIVSPATLRLVVSGQVDEQYQAEALRLADAFFRKPWRPDELEAVLRQGPSRVDLACAAAVRVARVVDESIERMAAHAAQRG